MDAILGGKRDEVDCEVEDGCMCCWLGMDALLGGREKWTARRKRALVLAR
jgi:hypothetical protein